MTAGRKTVLATAVLALGAAAAWAPPPAARHDRALFPAARAAMTSDTLTGAERSAAGGWLYLVADSGQRHDVLRVRPAGGTAEPVFRGGANAFPWEPAREGGAMLLVLARDSNGLHHERVVMQREGSPAQPLTVWSGRMRNPSWSPDGRWVAVESDQFSFGDVVRVDVASRTVRRLTTGTAGSYEPAVSPDGREIAFVSSRSGNAEVYVMRADGAGVRRLTASPRDSWSPRWSPDGRRIAFTSSRGGRDRIYLVNADGTGLVPLTGVAGEASSAARPFEGEGAPAWSPDGRAIALAARVAGGHMRAYVKTTGGDTRAVSPEGIEAGSMAWSPDGRLLAVGAGTAKEGGIFVVRPDGTGWTRVGPVGAWMPRWTRQDQR